MTCIPFSGDDTDDGEFLWLYGVNLIGLMVDWVDG